MNIHTVFCYILSIRELMLAPLQCAPPEKGLTANNESLGSLERYRIFYVCSSLIYVRVSYLILKLTQIAKLIWNWIIAIFKRFVYLCVLSRELFRLLTIIVSFCFHSDSRAVNWEANQIDNLSESVQNKVVHYDSGLQMR